MESTDSLFSKKGFKIAALFFIAALAGIMVVLTFFDLQISKALYHPNSEFGHAFRVLGEVPSRLIIPVFLTALYCQIKRFKLIRIITIIAMPASNIFWLRVLISEIEMAPWASWLLTIILCLVSSVILLWGFLDMPKEARNKLFYILLAAAILTAFSTVAVHTLKIIWGRVRFRSLQDGYANFTRWFVIRGNTGNKSFPSGHTSSACTLLALPLLCIEFRMPLWTKITITASSFGFILCTMLSRIILGAHYATDVVFSLLLCCLLLWLSAHISCLLHKFVKIYRDAEHQ